MEIRDAVRAQGYTISHVTVGAILARGDEGSAA